MEVSVRDLKSRLSEYLRLARAGEEVVVTVHGKPVARLVPIDESPGDAEAALIEELAALTWVRPGDGAPVAVSAAPMASCPGDKPLSAAVLEDRE